MRTSFFAFLVASLYPGAVEGKNDCHLAFHTKKGLHTVPLKGGAARRIGSSGILDASPHGSMGVDGVRGLAVWSEDNKIYTMKLSDKDATPNLLVTITRTGRALRAVPKHVHGLALQTETETAFISAHEDVGGYRVASFKYTDPQPTLNWKWCKALNCGVLSRKPSGGSLATGRGRLFVTAARATKTRDPVEGGCSLGYWTTGTSDIIKMNSEVEALNTETPHRFRGVISNVHVDELTDKVYVSETSAKLYSRIWETNVSGDYFKIFSEYLPPFQVMGLEHHFYGAPTCSHAYLGAGQFAVSNTSHVFIVTEKSIEENNILFSLPEDEVGEDSFMAPLVKYCDGEHTGGVPRADPLHDEL
eukprot:TRINITY_DN2200_c2_g1_i2.p1 TRINITY_DN2200_c2_g1~~TRINITY_DN2200_c2_g1_i2.p1  ORF type:complete len:360 (+),score=48.96 TRINITY_DN2200_c2_g1_i2:112-1191(+)